MTAENGCFYKKNALYDGKFLILGGWGCWLKIFGPQHQKVYSLAKSGRINRLAYVAVAVFKRYTAAREKVRETPIGISSRLALGLLSPSAASLQSPSVIVTDIT